MQSLVHMACLFDYLDRVSPGLVVDVNIPHSLKGFDGLVVQVMSIIENKFKIPGMVGR